MIRSKTKRDLHATIYNFLKFILISHWLEWSVTQWISQIFHLEKLGLPGLICSLQVTRMIDLGYGHVSM